MSEPTEPAVLIVDDHKMIATTFELALRAEGFSAARSAGRGVEGILADARRHRPGVVLLDLDLGWDEQKRPVSGVQLVQPLVRDGWRVIVVSGTGDRLRLGAALHEGALAWLPKQAPLQHLLAAVTAAFAGRPVMPPDRRESMIADYRAQADVAEELAARFARLSQREREVLDELARGMRAQAIADHYVVSLATIRTQIRGILKKLEVGSQLEAVVLHRGRRRP